MVIMSGDHITAQDFPDELVGNAVLPMPHRSTSRMTLREFKETAEREFPEVA